MTVDVPTAVFREWGRENGFRRKGTTLYRDQQETIAVVNLQGSRYGGRYYVNVALWFKAVGEEPFPKESQCQLRTRLARLRALNASEDEAYLNLGSDLSDDDRKLQFRSALDLFVTPALADSATVEALQRQPEVLRRFMINKDAHELGLRGGLGSTPNSRCVPPAEAPGAGRS